MKQPDNFITEGIKSCPYCGTKSYNYISCTANNAPKIALTCNGCGVMVLRDTVEDCVFALNLRTYTPDNDTFDYLGALPK